MWWMDFKTGLTDAIGLSRDALHLISGLGIHLFLVLLFRTRFSALWPVGIVALFALGNEWLDLANEDWGEERGRQYQESAKDLVTTMLVPTVLLLLSRFAPSRFAAGPGESE